MKITVQMHNSTYSVETEQDELTIGEITHQFKGLLVLAGFHPHAVEDHFLTDEFTWFHDREDTDVDKI